MNPEYRTLRQVTIDNGGEADRIFSMLMGDEVPPRREFIEKNAKYANIDAENNKDITITHTIKMKVTIVGAGNVGATCADAIAYQGMASEVVLLDIKEGFAEGRPWI